MKHILLIIFCLLVTQYLFCFPINIEEIDSAGKISITYKQATEYDANIPIASLCSLEDSDYVLYVKSAFKIDQSFYNIRPYHLNSAEILKKIADAHEVLPKDKNKFLVFKKVNGIVPLIFDYEHENFIVAYDQLSYDLEQSYEKLKKLDFNLNQYRKVEVMQSMKNFSHIFKEGINYIKFVKSDDGSTIFTNHAFFNISNETHFKSLFIIKFLLKSHIKKEWTNLKKEIHLLYDN